MKLEHLGHASWIVRGREGTLLVDPLLMGVHHEGLYDIHPPRELDLEGLPPIDAVLLSHGHPDHFDLPSLALLPRELLILVPADNSMLGCLQGLGFRNVSVLPTLQMAQVGSLGILPTPGAAGALEHGFLFVDGETVVWNLVDTFPSVRAIAEIRARLPEIHLAIVPWQPLQDIQFAQGRGIGFPYEMYETILANTLAIDAGALVAGACGFRAAGDSAWTNQLIFPVTRERWLADVAALSPRWASRAFTADPGDVLVVEGSRVEHQGAALSYCRSQPWDWRPLSFRPYELGFPLAAPPPAFSTAECLGMIRAFLEESVARHVEEKRPHFEWHFRWKVRQQIEVLFADERRFWLLDFSGPRLRVVEEQDPLALSFSLTTAEVLARLIASRTGWEYVQMSGAYRHHQHHYLCDSLGLRRNAAARLIDVLQSVFGTSEAEGLRLLGEVEDLMRAKTDPES